MTYTSPKMTKIIATLGPASESSKTLTELMEAGVDIVRLNASHQSDPTVIRSHVKRIRQTAQKLNKHVAVFLDLQGPKIRVGDFENKKVMLKTGQTFFLTTEKLMGTEKGCSVSYSGFLEDVMPGEHLFLDDGKIRIQVQSKKDNKVFCKVMKGAEISNRKGINLPESNIRLGALSQKDREDAKLAVENKLEYIALSFVATAQDVLDLRHHLDALGGKDIKIIAKIERQQAIENIVSIIEASDVVMVARGDLGVEIGHENVPRVQKKIIRECNRRVKPVIVATQMLESMIHIETATRAEVSDVANAVYDQCDAVMLSGETAIGVNPVRAVETMRDICIASDSHMVEIKLEEYDFSYNKFVENTVAVSFCKAADQIAYEHKAKALMVFTSSGNTPKIASKLSPINLIIAPTDDEFICRQMSMFRGVFPLLLPKKFKDIHRWTDMNNIAIKESQELGILDKKDLVVITAGRPIGVSNGINSIRLVTV